MPSKVERAVLSASGMADFFTKNSVTRERSTASSRASSAFAPCFRSCGSVSATSANHNGVYTPGRNVAPRGRGRGNERLRR